MSVGATPDGGTNGLNVAGEPRRCGEHLKGMRTVSLAPVALLASIALLATSCGTGNGLADSLIGNRYAAESASGFELPDASNVVITFDEAGPDDDKADGRLGVTGGCNLIGGGFTLEDDTLLARGGWIQTEMACDGDLMTLDNTIVHLLDSRPTLVLDGTVLTITSGDGSGTSLTLREA